MISGNRDEAWPMYLVWPISERFVLGQSGGTWPACCHWPNTGRVDARCPIMSVLTQSYQCGTWFVCSILRELAVSNQGQPLFCLSITWSRCRNAYRDLWIMTITPTNSLPNGEVRGVLRLDPNLTWWAYQAISLLSKPGTLSAGGLISPLFSLSLWWHLWSAAAN